MYDNTTWNSYMHELEFVWFLDEIQIQFIIEIIAKNFSDDSYIQPDFQIFSRCGTCEP